MNKQRRREIKEAVIMIEAGKDLLQNAMDEEQEYRDNIPEGIAEGERGDRADEVIYQLETAIDGIDEAMNEVEQAAG